MNDWVAILAKKNNWNPVRWCDWSCYPAIGRLNWGLADTHPSWDHPVCPAWGALPSPFFLLTKGWFPDASGAPHLHMIPLPHRHWLLPSQEVDGNGGMERSREAGGEVRAGYAARAVMAGGWGRKKGRQDWSICPAALKGRVSNVWSRLHILLELTSLTRKCRHRASSGRIRG